MRPIQLLSTLLLVLCLKSCLNQRRLSHGKRTNAEKPYMVYLVQSNQSSKNYDNYLCGGALISTWQVLTAAGCLVELTHMYVIAGYIKYVNGRAIEYDACTRTKKNRVIKTCVPKEYKLAHNKRSLFMTLDIGVAYVEKRYDPDDRSWLDHCSYIPKPIRISYDARMLEPKTDVVAFGWGGSFFRTATDILDHNSPYLQELSLLILEKLECNEKFGSQNLTEAISSYMICVGGVGNLDGEGYMANIGSTVNNGCFRRDGSNCSEDDTRRKFRARHAMKSKLQKPVPSRRHSICQNDHGGPLISWMGSEEVIIGVAVSGVIDQTTMICVGPSLFTSTHCTGKILECLSASTKESRRRCAETIKSDGLGIEDVDIDWSKLPGDDLVLTDSDSE